MKWFAPTGWVQRLLLYFVETPIFYEVMFGGAFRQFKTNMYSGKK